MLVLGPAGPSTNTRYCFDPSRKLMRGTMISNRAGIYVRVLVLLNFSVCAPRQTLTH